MRSDKPFEIIAVDGKNVHLVPSAFRSVYGDDFPVQDVYRPDTLWKHIQEGRLIAGLALDTKGRGAGYVSLFKPAPNPRLWEVGNLLVIPEYSQTDLSSRLARYCMDLGMHGTGDIDGIVAEAVCCHYFTQMVAAKSGLVDCGIALDQLNGASFKDGKSNRAGTARVSCVLTFWEVAELLQKEYVPVRYDSIVRRIAAALRPRSAAVRSFLRHRHVKNRLPYEGLLRHVDAHGDAWKAPQREVAEWWEARSGAALELARRRAGNAPRLLRPQGLRRRDRREGTANTSLHLSGPGERPPGAIEITYHCASVDQDFAREIFGHLGYGHVASALPRRRRRHQDGGARAAPRAASRHGERSTSATARTTSPRSGRRSAPRTRAAASPSSVSGRSRTGTAAPTASA